MKKGILLFGGEKTWGSALETALNELFVLNDDPYLAQYGDVTTLESFKNKIAPDLTLLSVSPHYRQEVTGNILSEVHRWLRDSSWRPTLTEIPHWPDSPALIGLMIEEISLLRKSSDTHLVFVTRAPQDAPGALNVYSGDCVRTASALIRFLNAPWSVAHMSQTRGKPPLGDHLKSLDEKGIQDRMLIWLEPSSPGAGFSEENWYIPLLNSPRLPQLYRSLVVFDQS